MSAPSRRDFLGLAQNAVAAGAVGAIAFRFIGAAEAIAGRVQPRTCR